MNDEQLLAALDRDDSYRVIRVLADKPSGKTELVKGDAQELYVRKYVPDELANKRAWYRLQELSLPLLPKVVDIYELPGTFVTVSTYVEGVVLSELVSSVGVLSPTEAANYVQDLCAAAAILHSHDIVHRDITPGNVVVAQGHARLIDLGNARAYTEGAGHDTTRMGTWGFAAPEQYGFAQTDARSDIYSLGSVLGYLLTGVQPGDETFERALEEKNIPEDMRNVVRTARAFEPSARYQNATEMADDLEKAEKVLGGGVSLPASAEGTYQLYMPMSDSIMDKNGSASTPSSQNAADLDASGKGKGAFAKIGKASIWLVGLFFGLIFLAAGFNTSKYVSTIDPIYYPIAGIICCSGTMLVTYQVQACVFKTGRYSVASNRWLLLLKTVVFIALATVLLVTLDAIVFAFFEAFLSNLASS